MHNHESGSLSTLLCGRGVYTKVSALDTDLVELQHWALKQFGCVLPDDYISFLKQSDGVQIQNASFLATTAVAPLNTDAPLLGQIRIGSAGNTDDYVIDVNTKKFAAIPIGRSDEPHGVYDTFRELLAIVLNEQGVQINA